MNTHRKVKFFVGTLVVVMMTALNLHAASVVTLQGRILTPSGDPLAEAGVKIRVQVLTPNSNECILFDETHTVDMSATEGLFSVGVNDGLGTRNDSNSWNFSSAISNATAKAVPSTRCSSGAGTVTYTPSNTDERKVAVFFQRAGMSTWEEMTDASGRPYLTHAPYAMESDNSIAVGGFSSDNLCRVANAGVPQSVPALSSADFTELQSLVAGTSSKFMKSSTTEGTSLPVLTGSPVTLAAGKIWYEGGVLKYYDAANSAVRTLGTSGSGVANGTQAGAVTIGSSDANALTLKTNNTDRLKIDSSGNVGIGTSLPLSKLSVVGSSQTPTGAGAEGIQQISTGTGVVGDEKLQFGIKDGSYAWIQAVKPSVAYRNLALNPAGGSVTVGTGSPINLSPFTISSSDATISAQATSSAAYVGMNMFDQTGTLSASFQWGNSGAGTFAGSMFLGTRVAGAPLILLTGGANERMRIDGSGNVGIGTTTATSKLTVAGTIQSTTGGIKFPDNTVQTTAYTGGNSKHLTVVSYPLVSGSSGGISLSSGSFTKCTFNTVDTDAEGNWNSANNWYVVPETGNYQIITKLRVQDSVSAGQSFGQGAGLTAVDNADFAWFVTNSHRNGSLNIRTMSLNAGDKIIMYYYADGFTGQAQVSMTIYKL